MGNNPKSKIFLMVISRLSAFLFFLFLLLFLFASASYASEEAKRVLSIVDYIGGDYKNAIQKGKIIDEREYEEMLGFSSDVIELFSEVKASDGDKAGIEADLVKLRKKIEDKSSNEEIELISKGIK